MNYVPLFIPWKAQEPSTIAHISKGPRTKSHFAYPRNITHSIQSIPLLSPIHSLLYSGIGWLVDGRNYRPFRGYPYLHPYGFLYVSEGGPQNVLKRRYTFTTLRGVRSQKTDTFHEQCMAFSSVALRESFTYWGFICRSVAASRVLCCFRILLGFRTSIIFNVNGASYLQWNNKHL